MNTLLTEQQLNTLKKILLEEKQNLQGTINAKDGILNHENEKDSMELSSYDNHPADLGTELYEREKDMALSVHEEDQLGKVEAALFSMEKGTYGKCEICEKEIPYDRLEVIPYATTCMEHTPERSIPSDSPAELDYLKPAYDNSYAGRHKEEGIRDYHDSFQEVARYGTSETPSDFEGDFDSYEELYHDKIRDGFTEEYEMFTGNDMKTNDVKVFKTDDEREYKEELDDEGTDAPFGDLPYHQTDGYVDKDKE
ncbi:TraR/DksA C4-type zinc finger protein [Siminovitchia terrae]|uniref:TraR/DksA C4-type zinc finger protein n=1 Tax=Siminovitchia terrae TaxID=1914933 RepID=UPI001FD09528|nr:TraR/DksA C4-type zinc finger protein [Siminovitchia terrae]